MLGDWLAEHHAEYARCTVGDDGTRELLWRWLAGAAKATPRQRRELLVRSLSGDLDRWDLVVREVGRSRVGGQVYHYDSTSTTGLTLAQLLPAVIELVDADWSTSASPPPPADIRPIPCGSPASRRS